MTNKLELEKTLWSAAGKLRNNKDAAEYKHVVLGLISLNIFQILLTNSTKNWKQRKIKQVRTRRTRTNTQRKEYFMSHLLHVGNGYKAEQNFQLSVRTLMMQWMP